MQGFAVWAWGAFFGFGFGALGVGSKVFGFGIEELLCFFSSWVVRNFREPLVYELWFEGFLFKMSGVASTPIYIYIYIYIYILSLESL